MISHQKAAEVSLAITLLVQEMPFGLVPQFSEEAQTFMDIPMVDLNEYQAQLLINESGAQRREFFAREAEKVA